jgi:hypothetical protein
MVPVLVRKDSSSNRSAPDGCALLAFVVGNKLFHQLSTDVQGARIVLGFLVLRTTLGCLFNLLICRDQDIQSPDRPLLI